MFDIPTNYGKPKTQRVKNLYKELYRTPPRVDSQRAVLYTGYIKDHAHEHLYLKTAGAFRHALSHMTPVIFDNELLVGSFSRYPMGAQIYPELEKKKDAPAVEVDKTGGSHIQGPRECFISEDDRNNIDNAAQFWLEQDLYTQNEAPFLKTEPARGRAAIHRTDTGVQSAPSDVPNEWIVITYQKILSQGAESIINCIQEFLGKSIGTTNPDSYEIKAYLNSIICLLEGIITFAQNYAHEAKRLASMCSNSKRKKELNEIARICMKVPGRPPDTFREALQSFWFVHVCMCLISPERNASPGRFDQYMNPYFEHDLSSSTLSTDEAVELLELMRIKCEGIVRAYKDGKGNYLYKNVNQYITLAGSDISGNASDTLLSKFLLHARINIHTEQPVLAVRWRNDLTDFFKHKIIDCIKTAGWCPDIYHEHIGTKRCSRKTGMPGEKLRDWIVYPGNSQSIGNLMETMDLLFRKNQSKILDMLLEYGNFSSKKLSPAEEEAEKKRFRIMLHRYHNLIHQTARRKIYEDGSVFMGAENTGIVHPCLRASNIFSLSSMNNDTSPMCSYSNLDRISALSLIDLAKTITVLADFLSEEALFTLSEIREAIQTDFEGTETMRQKILGQASLSIRHPLFEETLIELFDTWALFADKWTESTPFDRSGHRRFTLIRGNAARTEITIQ